MSRLNKVVDSPKKEKTKERAKYQRGRNEGVNDLYSHVMGNRADRAKSHVMEDEHDKC